MNTPKTSHGQIRRHSLVCSSNNYSQFSPGNSNCPTPTPIANSSPMYKQDNRHLHNRTVQEEGTIRSSLYGNFSTVTADYEEDGFRSKFNSLLSSINVQQDQISQAIAALNFCRKVHETNDTFQEVNARRLLLIAQERLGYYNNELEHLKEYQMDTTPVAPTDGLSRTMEISLMVLTLNNSFSLKLIDSDVSYFFVILCRYGEQIHATHVVNVLDMGKVRHIKLRFKEFVLFQNLPEEFKIRLEVHALKIEKRKSFINSMLKFAKFFTRCRPASSELYEKRECGDPNSGFQLCGWLFLTRETVGQQVFYLNDAAYPAEGTIEIHSMFEERQVV